MHLLRAITSFRSFAALLLATMLVAAPPLNVLIHVPVSQDQLQERRHVNLAPVSEEHGHTHDDGEPSEQLPGHSHSHTSVDHSHDTPNPLASMALSRPFLNRASVILPEDPAKMAPTFRLDRPPRLIL
jgi:hypothetical protein